MHGISTKSLSSCRDQARSVSGGRSGRQCHCYSPPSSPQSAERFFRRLLKTQGGEPRWLVTDKLLSYDAGHRMLMPTVNHLNHVYANNRAEVSHEPTRQRERAIRGFSSTTQAQRFLTLHRLAHNLFRLGRHLMQAVNYRIFRTQAFFRFGRKWYVRNRRCHRSASAAHCVCRMLS
jgi:hypothetical protein